MEGRQILDNIIIVQESIHSTMEIKQYGMVIKLDMANSFDKINHNFLLGFMQKMGFSLEFIRWIKDCIGNLWIAPLVNRRPTNIFQASRGLRQGWPLSPSVFLFVVEALNKKLQVLRDRRELIGLKIARGIKVVNNAQFTDEQLFWVVL